MFGITRVFLAPTLDPLKHKYLEEADRFVTRDWTVLLNENPVVPFFSAVCGSVCRHMEPDRPMCTNDAGAPQKDRFDADGVRMIPLNEPIDKVAWPKELKLPTLIMAIAMKVLHVGGRQYP